MIRDSELSQFPGEMAKCLLMQPLPSQYCCFLKEPLRKWKGTCMSAQSETIRIFKITQQELGGKMEMRYVTFEHEH